MAPTRWEVVDGKRVVDGRTLDEWELVAVDEVARRLAPLRIILFGSVARGDDGPDSDIDLLVVFEHLPGRTKHEAAVAVRQAISVPAAVDVLVTDLAELAERGDLPGVLRWRSARERSSMRGRPERLRTEAWRWMRLARENLGAVHRASATSTRTS